MRLKPIYSIVALLILAGLAHAQPTSKAYLTAEAKKDTAFIKAQDLHNKSLVRYMEQYLRDLKKVAPMVQDADDLQAIKLEEKYLTEQIAKIKNPPAEPEPDVEHTDPEFLNLKAKSSQTRYNSLVSKAADMLVKQKVAALKAFKRDLDVVRLAALRADDTDEAVAVKQVQIDVDTQIDKLQNGDESDPKIIRYKWDNGVVVELHPDGRVIVVNKPDNSKSVWSRSKNTLYIHWKGKSVPESTEVFVVLENGAKIQSVQMGNNRRPGATHVKID